MLLDYIIVLLRLKDPIAMGKVENPKKEKDSKRGSLRETIQEEILHLQVLRVNKLQSS